MARFTPRRVSIIIPFLNPGAFLSEAIDSVFAQTFGDWDLWLVDDGSSDGSTAVARATAAEHPDRVHYVDHPGHANLGLPASRNLGIARSAGDLVAFLDADDVWLAEKLERQVAALDACPEAGMACESSQYWFSWTGRPEDQSRDFVPSITAELGLPGGQVLQPPRMLLSLYPLGTATAPCPSSLVVRSSLLRRLGGFEESFRGHDQLYEDQTLLTKIYLHAPVYLGNGWTHRYRRHDRSIEAGAIGGGHYERVRLHFLQWLGEYFRTEDVRDQGIWEAYDRAVASTPTPVQDRSA